MQSDRYWEAKKITLFGAFVNALLGIIKLIGGILYHSHALVADGIHSFSDLLTDITVLFASKFSNHAADVDHPYGHQRIETAGTLLLALLLILTGSAIAWHAFDDLLQASTDKPGFLTLPIALLSIIANEALFFYTRRVGERIQSPLILANAWHHRSDAAASVVVLVGLLGSFMGWLYLDAIAAIVIGFLIIKMGLDYGWNSVKELIDTGVELPLLEKITHIIEEVNGVKKIHQLRTRLMGHNILIDVHVLVSPRISVSEGHFVAQHVHHALMKKLDRVKDVTVHIDPEDDELVRPSLDLPNRDIVTRDLLNPMRADFPELSCLTLHYLNGKITLDLLVQEPFDQWPALQARIQQILQTESQTINDIRVFQRCFS